MHHYQQIRPSNQRPDESMTLSKPTNQQEAEEITSWFELVKVISRQSVIIWRFNSTTGFVRIRLRSKGNLRSVGSALRGISWGTSMTLAASRLQSWTTTDTTSNLRQLHHRSNDVIAGSTQTTVINKSSYILSTEIHLTSFERWTKFWKQWIECAHTNGHRHSLIPYLYHRSISPILRTIND